MPSVIANEQGLCHITNHCCVHWIVVYVCIASYCAVGTCLQHRATEGDRPVCDLLDSIYGVYYLSSIPLDWNVNGWYASSKHWHMSEADRKHVPWGSCEKNFENIVIRTWIRCIAMELVCGCVEIVICVCNCEQLNVVMHMLIYCDASCRVCNELCDLLHVRICIVSMIRLVNTHIAI